MGRHYDAFIKSYFIITFENVFIKSYFIITFENAETKTDVNGDNNNNRQM